MSFIRQKKIKHNLRAIVLVLITVYLMIGSSLYYLQEKLMFFPSELEENFQYQFNYPFEELFLKTDDAAVINAIHFKAEKSKGVILYFHGNAGDLSRWGIVTEFFVKKNYDVLVIDYRTYGKSKGKLSEEAFYLDGQFCYDYLKQQYSESDITLYGRSLGSGVATYLASKNNPKQLILESPYYSIIDVAKHRFPIFPIKKLLRYKFPTYEYIKNVKCLTSILHGTEDAVIPIKSAKKLFDVSFKDKTEFTIIEGGGHNNLVEFKGYQERINEILE